MIYLASPYSADPARNHVLTARCAAELFRRRHMIFSPILHWHETAAIANLETDADFWWGYNQYMLGLSSALLVLKLPGWSQSSGVAMELQWWRANRRHEPIFLTAKELGVENN